MPRLRPGLHWGLLRDRGTLGRAKLQLLGCSLYCPCPVAMGLAFGCRFLTASACAAFMSLIASKWNRSFWWCCWICLAVTGSYAGPLLGFGSELTPFAEASSASDMKVCLKHVKVKPCKEISSWHREGDLAGQGSSWSEPLSWRHALQRGPAQHVEIEATQKKRLQYQLIAFFSTPSAINIWSRVASGLLEAMNGCKSKMKSHTA